MWSMGCPVVLTAQGMKLSIKDKKLICSWRTPGAQALAAFKIKIYSFNKADKSLANVSVVKCDLIFAGDKLVEVSLFPRAPTGNETAPFEKNPRDPCGLGSG